jgi:hypothetical protein
MFKARPEIVSAQATMGIADYTVVTVPSTTKISEAALVGLGSMTHSFDMNQRHVQLRVLDPGITMRCAFGAWVPATSPEQCLDGTTACIDLYILQTPPTREMAPPGPYMLFVLDENRVPSMGKIVDVQ